MRINTRFPVAVHMMSLMAFAQDRGTPATSELLAKSVGTNPVVIRQMVSLLKQAGLVATKNGVPGSALVRPPEEITLLDIYKAVQKDADAPLFDFHLNPNPNCFVGKNIGEAMAQPLRDAQAAMEHSLEGCSLKDITDVIGKRAHLFEVHEAVHEKEAAKNGGNKMLKKIKLYYFSPTGGTEKVGNAFAKAIAEQTDAVDLGSRAALEKQPDTELIAVAAPVFGGRIPAVVTEKLQTLDGTGKKAVTLAVYGNRAYEDALLELNDVLTGCGFQILASGAFIAQHSMVPQVAAGRPDEQDMAELTDFAQKVLANLEKGAEHPIQVPGNRPYKQEMVVPAVPVSLSSCTLCGKCEPICPVSAILQKDGSIQTDTQKCILCMACTYVCPEHARILPPPLQEKMDQMLGALKSVRNGNEIFL